MSNRFYVNDVQIFGNNEMFKKTYDELKRQGAEWTEDFTFGAIEIKEPQALMDAVEQDSLEYLKKALTENVWDEKEEKTKNVNWEDVKDIDLLSGFGPRDLVNYVYDKDGNPKKCVWRRVMAWISEKRIFTSYNLFLAIKNDVERTDNGLVLKDGHSITACMY